MTAAQTSSAQLSEWIGLAVRHLNAGKTDAAETELARALTIAPDLPQARMMLGAVRLAQNRPADAEQILAEVLALHPGQPQVMLPLADARRALGKLEEAAALYRQLLARQPHHAAAIAGLGAALNALEQYEEAQALLSPAMALDAEAELAASLTLNLGISLMRRRQFAQSLPYFERALVLAPGLAEAEKCRATVLDMLGRDARAASAYRRILARDPLDLKSHLLLGELLNRAGGETLRSYDEAARALPASPALPAAKADQLLLLARAEEAHSLYRRALALDPGHVAAHIGLGRSLKALGDDKAAQTAFEAGLKTAPDNPDLQTAFAYFLLGQRDARKALMLATRAAASNPTSQPALSILGLSYRALNDARDESLTGYQRFVQVFDLEPPDGYRSMADFHRDLAAHLDELHSGGAQFFSQTLRGGTRATEEIFAFRQELRDKLRHLINQTLARYIGALGDEPSHPFAGRRASRFKFLGSWSSRMSDGGFHMNHIHNGWISSAYYVDVPEISAQPVSNQGWLKFGEPSEDIGLSQPVQRMVQPKPGRLVLFPSYMWHGTVPYKSGQARTTIAFDVIPF